MAEEVKQMPSLSRAPGSSASSTSASSSEKGETEKNGGGASAGKRSIAQLAAEKIEPYVRKRRCSGSSSERSRKRREHLSEKDQNILRININSRERKRMHDLNDALDDLRKAFPFAVNGERAGARKLSKIDTIVLAKNWILQLNKELAELRANNERLLLELLTVKTNGQNGKTTAPVGTNGTDRTTDDQPSVATIGNPSTSSQRNASQWSGTEPCQTFGSVGLLHVPPSRIPSADSANSVLPSPFVPFTVPMLSTNGPFLVQEKSNQILGNAFAVQHLLAMKSADNLRPENDGADLFGCLPKGIFPANFQMSKNEQSRNETAANRKRKTNGGRKEEKKKSADASDHRKVNQSLD